VKSARFHPAAATELDAEANYYEEKQVDLASAIVWHIANGVTGGIMLALAYGLYPSQGIAAFPMAMLAAYSLFYTVFAMYKTSTTYKLSLLKFESGASLPPAIAQLLVMGGLLISQR